MCPSSEQKLANVCDLMSQTQNWTVNVVSTGEPLHGYNMWIVCQTDETRPLWRIFCYMNFAVEHMSNTKLNVVGAYMVTICELSLRRMKQDLHNGSSATWTSQSIMCQTAENIKLNVVSPYMVAICRCLSRRWGKTSTMNILLRGFHSLTCP